MQKCSGQTFSPVVLVLLLSLVQHSLWCLCFPPVPSPSYVLDIVAVHSPFASVVNCGSMEMFLQGAPLLTKSQPYEPQSPYGDWGQASPGGFPHGISAARWGL